jgi:type II secretion system protein C
MMLSRKIPAFFQGPSFISSLTGLFIGVLVAAFLSGRTQVSLTSRIARHLETRLESVRPIGNSAHRYRDYRHLGRLSVWGKPATSETAAFHSTASAMPFASIPYALKGIVRYPDGTYEAVFTDHNHKTFFLKTGDTRGPMKILTILPDRLIVEQGGKRGTLELFRTSPAKRRPYKKEKNQPVPGGATHVVLDKKEVQNALKNMGTFLKQVRIVPYLEKGSAKGFKLLEIVPGSIVARVGLKNGDIIESVNGKPIQTPQDALQLFTLLQAGKGISLVLSRHRQQKTMVIDLR